jgi:hypothetical protein
MRRLTLGGYSGDSTVKSSDDAHTRRRGNSVDRGDVVAGRSSPDRANDLPRHDRLLPTSTEPLAVPMNAIPNIVVSRSGSLPFEPATALRNATQHR